MSENTRPNEERQFNDFLNFLKSLKIPNLMEEQLPVEAAPAPEMPEVVEPEPVEPTAEEPTSGVQTFNDKKQILSIKRKQREARANLRDRKTSSQMAGLNPLGIKSGLNIPMV